MTPKSHCITIPVLRRPALAPRTAQVLAQLASARNAQADAGRRAACPFAITHSFERRKGTAQAGALLSYTLLTGNSVSQRRLVQLPEDIRPLAGYAAASIQDDEDLLSLMREHIATLGDCTNDPLYLDAHCTEKAILVVAENYEANYGASLSEVEALCQDLSRSYTLVLVGDPSNHEALTLISEMTVFVGNLIRDALDEAIEGALDEETVEQIQETTWRFVPVE